MEQKINIIIGKNAGFCYGVNRAVEGTIEVLNKGEKVYCLGEIVHNKQVVEELEKKGLKVIEKPEDIQNQNAKVIIRAHGEPPKTYQELQTKNSEVIDFTCPNVLAIHKLAKQYSDKDYYIFVTGKQTHPEVIGIVGNCKHFYVIENRDDIEKAILNFQESKLKNLCIISQTTFSLSKFEEFSDEIQEKLKNEKINIEIRNTICNATKIRQEETEELSKKVDYMIIVGGKNSSNTKKMYEIACSNCKNAICIETADELNIENIKNKKNILCNDKSRQECFTVGIMAGASTPKKSIEDVYDKIIKNC